jgi:cytosine permease
MIMSTKDTEFSLEAVPQSNRKSFWNILVVMVSLSFFSASMWSGGTLGQGLSFWNFILIVLCGNLILGLYTGALAYISAKTGLSTHLLARYAFGEKGSYLTSFLLAATQVAWFGVGLAMFAVPVSMATGINVYILIGVFGIAMTISSIFGLKALAILGFISVPTITIFGSYSMTNAIDSMGGMEALMAYEPSQAMSISLALTICVGSFISAGTLTPDFTRFAKSPKSAVSSAVIAFFIGNSLMFLFGAIGAMAFGVADVSEVMMLQGLMIPAIIVLGLNIWTTNDSALYASGLGFANIFKLPKKQIVVVNGILGTLSAMWLYNNFVDFLTLLGSALPSIGAIILADYFIVRKKQYQAFSTTKFKAVNPIALFAWLCGIILANFVPGIPPLNALIGTSVIYVITMKLASYRQTVAVKNPINREEEVVRDY